MEFSIFLILMALKGTETPCRISRRFMRGEEACRNYVSNILFEVDFAFKYLLLSKDTLKINPRKEICTENRQAFQQRNQISF